MAVSIADRFLSWVVPPPLPEPPAYVPPALSAAAATPPPAAPSGGRDTSGRVPLSRQAPQPTEWQKRAWEFYRHCGEARQAVDWIANGVSRMHLYVGKVRDDGAGDPEPVDDPGLAGDILHELHSGPVGHRDMLNKLAIHLLVPGESWLIGYPPPPRHNGQDTTGSEDTSTTLWTVAARKEWAEHETTKIRLKLPKDPRRDSDNWVTFNHDEVVVVPVYNPDPEDSTVATSAFEAALSVLDELDGLSRRIGADINSRLAGAGVFAVPESATVVSPQSSGGVNPLHADPFLTNLVQSMMSAISDPDSASAVTPIVIKVPDDAIAKMQHLTFSTPFDAQLPTLREETRRRLAAVLDVPASVITGIEELNHWSAWAVDDSAIRSHMGPLVSLICTTITTEILWPALRANGVDDVEQWAVWWDATELVLRPDRSAEALAAYKERLISGKTTRRELGYNEDDAPEPGEFDNTSPVQGEDTASSPDAADEADRRTSGDVPRPRGGQPTPSQRPNPPAEPATTAASRRSAV